MISNEIDCSLFLPSGERTYDPGLYLEQWFSLANLAVSFFPGYEIASVNPDIKLECRNYYAGANRRDVYAVIDRVTLSVGALMALSASKANRGG